MKFIAERFHHMQITEPTFRVLCENLGVSSALYEEKWDTSVSKNGGTAEV